MEFAFLVLISKTPVVRPANLHLISSIPGEVGYRRLLGPLEWWVTPGTICRFLSNCKGNIARRKWAAVGCNMRWSFDLSGLAIGLPAISEG